MDLIDQNHFSAEFINLTENKYAKNKLYDKYFVFWRDGRMFLFEIFPSLHGQR